MMETLRRSCCWVALLAATVSATSEKCNSPPDGRVLVADEGTIWQLNPRDDSRETVASAASAAKLAYSYARNTLYYSEPSTRRVLALTDASPARVVVARQGEWLPWGLSVDDVNDKLYVLESFAGALHAYDLAGGRSSLLIGANVSEPRDLELDADAGYLFVLDRHQILRAELDGSRPSPIYQELASVDELFEEYPEGLADAVIGSFHPAPDRAKLYRKPIGIADLALDVRSRRVYWVDALKRTVESSDYGGHNGKVHFRDSGVEGQPESRASLAFSSGALFWADDVTRKLFRIDADSNESRVVASGVRSQAVAAVSCEQRAKTAANPCAQNPCQQICLRSKSSPTGYSCACRVGLELARDGKSCDSVRDSFVLFAQETYLRGQSSGESRSDAIEPSRFPVGRGSRLDLDAHAGTVYYSSLFPDDRLHEIQLASGRTRVLAPDLLSRRAGDLAYDWTTGNLYYLTYYYADATTLSVTKVDEPTYSRVLVESVPRLVRGLAVHPNRGYVFLARLDDRAEGRGSVSRLATDGTALGLILDLGRLDSLDALAVDRREDRLYWSETRTSGERVVRHANLDGEDARELHLAGGPTGASELAVGAEHIYGIGDGRLLFRVDRSGANARILVSGLLPGSLSDLKVFSRALQATRADHPCKAHGCQKFCFAVPSAGSSELTRTCGCPYGEKLAEDGLACVDNSEQEPAFLPCRFTSFKCNVQRLSPNRTHAPADPTTLPTGSPFA